MPQNSCLDFRLIRTLNMTEYCIVRSVAPVHQEMTENSIDTVAVIIMITNI
jgi:hypothetical protein